MTTGKWIKVSYKELVQCILWLHQIKQKQVLFQPLVCYHNHFTRYKHESTKGCQWCTPKIMWLPPQTTNEITNINATNRLKYIIIQYKITNNPPWYNRFLIKRQEVQNIRWNCTFSIMYSKIWAEMAQLKILPYSQWVGRWLWHPLHHHPGYASLHMLKYVLLNALPNELLCKEIGRASCRERVSSPV